MKRALLLILLPGILFSCKGKKEPRVIVQPRDTTITIANAHSDLFLDSTAMEQFISRQDMSDTLADRMRNFYNGRNYQYAWFDSTGIAEYVQSFLNMQNRYMEYARDSAVYNPLLQQLQDSIIVNHHPEWKNGQRLQTELELTEAFFRYAEKAYQGSSSINVKDLEWFIPRKKINMVGLLDSLVAKNGKNLANYEPVNKQYNLLKTYLLRYYQIEQQDDWDSISMDKRFYKLGDSATAIRQIKKRLFLLGDLPEEDSTSVFNETLTTAINSFQHRYGLKEDGVAGKQLLTALNCPIASRIRQLLINMERMRWIPANPPAAYILVNIPAYKLFVYDNDTLAWDMDVVVGSVAHNTVIFQGDMKYIVFSPYWNVPPGILKNEVLPGIKKDPRYLARHNMEWNNGGVRQKPGPYNSLGLVKFLFPNTYNIYLHDTPAKSLFSESSRAFSHGCIRLAEPRKLAEYLLRDDSTWTEDKITRAMNSGKEQYVVLKKKMPVFIGYFTAWVDQQGNLNFRDDVYGHDKKMEEQLFGYLPRP